ncbi:MAG: DUF998 domain-containing protein [Lachnospiraceae bacterium]|nr:DUF998 domain-containing protein [Lachnospiraceae bacterium]
MNKKLINWIGLLGVAALISYAAAIIFSPLAFPGYNWMEQAASDLSADSAPSRHLWSRLAAIYESGSVVCATCIAIFVSERKISTHLFRLGIYLFTIMSWISKVGYQMFALSDAGKDIAGVQEVMHMVVTVFVVLLSIVSLVLLIIAGCKDKKVRGIGIWAAVALALMFVGPVGMMAFPPEYFGVFERFSTFAAVGYNAVLGIYLFDGFRKAQADNKGCYTSENEKWY